MNIADIAVIVNGAGGGGGGGDGDVIYLIPKQTITITDAPVPITAENFDKAAEMGLEGPYIYLVVDDLPYTLSGAYQDGYDGFTANYREKKGQTRYLGIVVFDNGGEWAFVHYEEDTGDIVPATITITAAVIF